MTYDPTILTTVADEVHDPVKAEAVLSEQDEADLQGLIDDGNTYLRAGDEADAEFGRCAKAIFERKLHRPKTKDEFCQTEFGRSYETIRGYIKLAEHQEECEARGVEPLTCRAHVLVVDPLPLLDHKIRAMVRARAVAEEEGTKLSTAHLQQAREEIEDELRGQTAATNVDDPLAEAKEAVRTRGGIHIVLPAGSPAVAEHADAKPYGPGNVIVPFDPDASELLQQTIASMQVGQSLERNDLDEIAEYVYSVLTPDAWEPAKAWALGDEPFRATYQPARLNAPSERADSEGGDDRGSTVLLTPGVDLYHPDVPDTARQAVLASVKADPAGRYLAFTQHVDRVDGSELAPNVFICFEASDPSTAEACAEEATVLHRAKIRCVLVLRDCTGAIPASAFKPFEWVLVRGKKTSQAAYDSVFAAQSKGLIPPDGVQVGRTVRVRHQGYRPVTDGDLTSTEKQKRKDRRPTKIKTRPGSREGTPTV